MFDEREKLERWKRKSVEALILESCSLLETHLLGGEFNSRTMHLWEIPSLGFFFDWKFFRLRVWVHRYDFWSWSLADYF